MLSWGTLGFITGLLARFTVKVKHNKSSAAAGNKPATDLAAGIIDYGSCNPAYNTQSVMQKWWALVIAGILGGILFSLMMDVWTVLAYDGTFNRHIYLTAIINALPWTAVYTVSNIIFLLLLTKPITQKLDRIKIKYGVFCHAGQFII